MRAPDAAERAAVIDGLLGLATFLEEHPDVPAPSCLDALVCCSHTDGDDDAARADVDQMAALLGVTASGTGDQHYSAEKSWGPVSLRAYCITVSQREQYEARYSYSGNIQVPVTAAGGGQR